MRRPKIPPESVFMGVDAGPPSTLATIVRVLFALALCGFVRSAYAAELPPAVAHIPIIAGSEPDGPASMVAGVYLPAGDGPFPVLIYSHGRSSAEADRASTTFPDARGHIRYWRKKGFAVVAAIRPGYGATGGADHEDSGVRYDIFGNCWGEPEFARSAAAASSAIQATLAWVRQQSWADATRIVLAGASMGGLASIASASKNPDGVVAYINFSGGTGGSGERRPEHSCGSETMEGLMSTYGRSTHVPSLWLYAQNDSYWGASWPRAWHRAYARSGNPTHFVMTAAVPGADGHLLLARGSRLWTEHVDRFLEELRF
jgi:dienelactone hydrolase